MLKEKIALCPLCRGEAFIDRQIYSEEDSFLKAMEDLGGGEHKERTFIEYTIMCFQCGVSIRSFNKIKLLQIWNKASE